MTPEQTEKERRAFEAWYAAEWHLNEDGQTVLFRRFDEADKRQGSYRRYSIDQAFKIWLARARQSAWIDVKDRLPSDDEAVLVCSTDGGVFTDCYLSDALIWDFASDQGLTVTHWQPLPAAPQEAEE